MLHELRMVNCLKIGATCIFINTVSSINGIFYPYFRLLYPSTHLLLHHSVPYSRLWASAEYYPDTDELVQPQIDILGAGHIAESCSVSTLHLGGSIDLCLMHYSIVFMAIMSKTARQ